MSRRVNVSESAESKAGYEPELSYQIAPFFVEAGEYTTLNLVIQNKRIASVSNVKNIIINFRDILWGNNTTPTPVIVSGTGWTVQDSNTISPSLPISPGASVEIQWSGTIHSSAGICKIQITEYAGRTAFTSGNVVKLIQPTNQNYFQDLSASPSAVNYGDSLNLSWTSINLPDYCTLDSLILSVAGVGLEGTLITVKDFGSPSQYPDFYPESRDDSYKLKYLNGSSEKLTLQYILKSQVTQHLESGESSHKFFSSCVVEVANLPPAIDSINFSQTEFLVGDGTSLTIKWNVRSDVSNCQINGNVGGITPQPSSPPVITHKHGLDYLEYFANYVPTYTTDFIIQPMFDTHQALGIYSKGIKMYKRKLRPKQKFEQYKNIINIWEESDGGEGLGFLYRSSTGPGIKSLNGLNFTLDFHQDRYEYIYGIPLQGSSGNPDIERYFYGLLYKDGPSSYLIICYADQGKSSSLTQFEGCKWGFGAQPISLITTVDYATDNYTILTLFILEKDKLSYLNFNIMNGVAYFESPGLVNTGYNNFTSIFNYLDEKNYITDIVILVYNDGKDYVIGNCNNSQWKELYRSSFEDWPTRAGINQCLVKSNGKFPGTTYLYFATSNVIMLKNVPEIKPAFQINISFDFLVVKFVETDPGFFYWDFPHCNSITLLNKKTGDVYDIFMGDVSRPYSSNPNLQLVVDDDKALTFSAASLGMLVEPLSSLSVSSSSLKPIHHPQIYFHYYFTLLNGLRSSINFGLMSSTAMGLLNKRTAFTSVAIVETAYMGLTTVGLLVQAKHAKPVTDVPILSWRQGLIVLVIAAAAAALLWSDFNNQQSNSRRSQIGILLVAFGAFLSNIILSNLRNPFTRMENKLASSSRKFKKSDDEKEVVIDIPKKIRKEEIEMQDFMRETKTCQHRRRIEKKERKPSISKSLSQITFHNPNKEKEKKQHQGLVYSK